MDNTPDKQTIFKSSAGYYELHKTELLKKGYKITKENKQYSVFESATGATLNKESGGVSVPSQYGNDGASMNQFQ
jgi:hypothetical protein